MHIDLAAPDPCGGDPAPVFGQHAGDLVDVHLGPLFHAPSPVDLDGNRERLFRNDQRIKVRIDSRTELVAEWFDLPVCRIFFFGNELFNGCLPDRIRADGVRLAAGKSIRGKADHDPAVRAGELERAGKQALVAVVKRIKGAPYHNLHAVCTLSFYGIMDIDGKITGSPLFAAKNATVTGNITLGSDVGIWFGAVVRADKDRIVIGDRSNIQDNCVVHTSRGFPVTLGHEVSVGHGAILHGCTIGDRVLVGMGAIVLNGARVGNGSIIGAGAVVTEGMEVPENSVVIGVPGKVVKQTSDAQRDHIRKNAQAYVDLAGEYAHG